MQTIVIHPNDNVAVALETLPAGSVGKYLLREPIPRGHKFAIAPISSGQPVIKYGMPIGTATMEIQPGDHVHTHNLRTNLKGQLEYTYAGVPPTPPIRDEGHTFQGYRRADGSVGVRNHLFIVPTVGCINKLAEHLALVFNRNLPRGCDHALALTHPYGCSQLGSDHEMTRAILSGLVKHPNAAGVLVVGLGCENNTIASFQKLLGNYDKARIRFLVAQDCEDDFQAGMDILTELAQQASALKREPIPLSQLVVGLKCGGSDGLSGITANALVGRFSDRLVANGGTTILGEVPEMFGAESLLMARAASKEVFDKCVSMINGFKEYFMRYNQVIYENPSPGNKEGGISTLEDKSLGCTQKAGTSIVADVLQAGGHPCCQGLNLISGPGNDMVASTLLAASGAHLILFTTGRGTPFGTVVPTLKISSNSQLANHKPHWIDFDAGRLLKEDADSSQIDEQFFQLILDTASGKSAKNESFGYQEIAIFKDGVTL